jgi:hypothetical protein
LARASPVATHLTRRACRREGGVLGEIGSTCAATTCVPTIKACCLLDGTCVQARPTDCRQRSGDPQREEFCADVQCPQPTP